MPNILTPLIPSLQASLQNVAREATPINEVVDTSYGVEAAAVGQTVNVVSTAAVVGGDNTPGANHPGVGDLSPDNISVGITKSRFFGFRLTGEEYRAMSQNSARFQSKQVDQAIRSCMNEVWSDIAAMYSQAGYAYGTPGTDPFASDTTALSKIRAILSKESAPTVGRSLVLDPDIYGSLADKDAFKNVSYSAATETLREGIVSRASSFNIAEVIDVKTHTKGTGTGYLVNNASGYAAGVTSIALDTGSGTILPGDVVTFAGDTNKYIVASYSAPTLTLNAGLRQTLANDTAMTIANGGVRSMFGHKSSIAFGMRPPALPPEGDAAADRVNVTDPLTGITMSFAVYKQHMQTIYQVELAWGGKVVNPRWLGNLLV